MDNIDEAAWYYFKPEALFERPAICHKCTKDTPQMKISILPWYALGRHRVDSIRFLYRNTNAPFHLVSPHAARGAQAERFRRINRAFDTQAQPLEEVTIRYPCYLINLIIRVRDATSRKIWRWRMIHVRQKNPLKTSPPHN